MKNFHRLLATTILALITYASSSRADIPEVDVEIANVYASLKFYPDAYGSKAQVQVDFFAKETGYPCFDFLQDAIVDSIEVDGKPYKLGFPRKKTKFSEKELRVLYYRVQKDQTVSLSLEYSLRPRSIIETRRNKKLIFDNSDSEPTLAFLVPVGVGTKEVPARIIYAVHYESFYDSDPEHHLHVNNLVTHEKYFGPVIIPKAPFFIRMDADRPCKLPSKL